VAERLGRELVPGGLWRIVEPLIPAQRERPQGGGTRFVDDRAVFTAIVSVLTTGCAWRHLPAEVGVSPATAHRRFVAWTAAGLWRRLHRAVLDRLGEQAAVTGLARWSTRPACEPKKGRADWPEPGRPRQARLEAARAHRRHRAAVGGAFSSANTHDGLAHPLKLRKSFRNTQFRKVR
jgi:transposase